MDTELLAISEELEALGGGDARIGRFAAFCEVAACEGETDPRDGIVYATSSGHVVVRDPRCPPDTPASQAQRKYGIPLLRSFGRADQSLLPSTIQDAVDWVAAGFNCTAISFGQAGTGKSHLLFGGPHSQSMSDSGFLTRFLRLLFSRGDHEDWQVGVSCWEVVGADDAVDLLGQSPGVKNGERGGAPQSSTGFVCIKVGDISDVEQVLRFARSRSCNWASQSGAPGERLNMLPNRAHAFVRVNVFDRRTGCLSSLNLVDLIGSRPLDGMGQGARISKGMDPLSQSERERRLLNRQMLAFSRFMSELAQKDGMLLGSHCIAAARDTKLTSMLSNMIINNSRTLLFVTLSSKAEDYMDTVNTLRVASRGQSVQVACMRSFDHANAAATWMPKREALSIAAQQIDANRDGKSCQPRQSLSVPTAPFQPPMPSVERPHSALQQYTQQHYSLTRETDDSGSAANTARRSSSQQPPSVSFRTTTVDVTPPEQHHSAKAPGQANPSSNIYSQQQTPGEYGSGARGGPVSSAAPPSSTLPPGSMMSVDSTMHGSYGSYAQEYAKRRGKSLLSPPGSPMSYLPGTANQYEWPSGQTAAPDSWLSSNEVGEGGAGGHIDAHVGASQASEMGLSGSNQPPSTRPHSKHSQGMSPGRSEPSLADGTTSSLTLRAVDTSHSIKERFHELYGEVSQQREVEPSQQRQAGNSADQAPPTEDWPMSISPARKPATGERPYELPPSPEAHPIHSFQFAEPADDLDNARRGGSPILSPSEYAASQGRSAAAEGPSPAVQRQEGDDVGRPGAGGEDREQRSPQPAQIDRMAGQGAGGLEGLQQHNVWLLDLLEHEKRVVEKLKDKVHAAEANLAEVSTQYEVQLETAKQENVRVRSRCRRLEAESEFQSVFDDYEKEIGSLQNDMSALRVENAELLRMVSKLQASGAGPKSPTPVGGGEAVGGVNKIAVLQQNLRRAELERNRLAKELGEMKKNSRSARLHRSQAEDTMKRVQELQRKLVYKEQQVQQRGLAAADAAGRVDMLEVEIARLLQLNSSVTEENNRLKQSVNHLEEIVSKLRQPKRHALAEANLPAWGTTSPTQGRKTRAGQPKATELLKQLHRSLPSKNPKCEEILHRLVDEVQGLVRDRQTAAEREELLLGIIKGEAASNQ